MNILADEQLKMMEAGLTKEEYARRREAFLSLYYRLRKREEGRWYSRLSLRQRQKLHPLILFVYRAKNRLGGFTHEVLGDLRSKTDRPIIFAVTHVGKFDIEVISEAIRSHYYLLSGDYEHLQGIVDAPFLALNGVIYFNETVKEDRRSAKDRMIGLLREGGNLMYFPEGTWNMTPNLPMIPCYWGIVDIAKQGGAMIVPVAAEQYGKHFKVNIGANFDINAYGDDVAEKSRAIKDLRDTLAALKYEIWETVPAKRSEIAPDEWAQYTEARFREWPYFSLDYIAGLIYKPKGVTDPKDAFAHLDKLIPSRENAFLLRDRSFEERAVVEGYHIKADTPDGK